jgi:RNA polymerase sigma factor (sigma-70 family)
MSYSNKNLSECIENNPKAQRILYKKYSPNMHRICLRFAKNKMDADDILQEGFIKIFTKLKDFRNEGSFEGWMRRIMINTSINFYKRKYPYFKDIDFESNGDTTYWFFMAERKLNNGAKSQNSRVIMFPYSHFDFLKAAKYLVKEKEDNDYVFIKYFQQISKASYLSYKVYSDKY